ncbi:MAG: DUF934 domain-containing protein [Pseudomonadota bacterium]
MPTLNLTRVAPAAQQVDDTELLSFEALQQNEPIAALEIASDADLSEILPALDRIERIYVQFPAFTDGRGFSLARILRREGFTGLLVADGQLIPDQFAFALQCGFDAVRVADGELERHTPEAWQAALDDFDLTYQRGYAVKSGPATNIFNARDTRLEAGRADDPFSD